MTIGSIFSTVFPNKTRTNQKSTFFIGLPKRSFMKCPKCKSENPDSAKFCLECGTDLHKIDHNHSNSFSRPESYTPKYLAEKILTNRSSIEGERKNVTVVFVDVVNSTGVFEKIDPEAVHQIMNGCFKILLDEVHKYEGTINQFRGDGVMAIFGAPLAHEDHAQRACHAALGIKRTLKDYSEEIEKKHKIRFDVRIGMNTGLVVVGSIGDDLRMDYTADGDTTNLASRIESNARPGTILISSNTYGLVGQLFRIKSLGKTNVKGKEHPLDVYELIDEKIYRPRIGLERQIYSEMVGRDREIDSIELQLKRVIKGEGAVINIIGEAGIGKSRLLAELKDQDLMKQVMLLEGKAISIGKNLSFYPIIDILKQWALIKEEDKKTTAFNKLETAVMDLHPKEANEIVPFIATLMGMKLTGKYAERVRGIEGEALENLIFKNFRELLIQATKLQPVVMIIEDVHWADLSSIGFLESIFRLAEGHRILFINAIRPAYEETGDRIIKTLKEDLKAHYIEVKLTSLDDRSSETLINNMLKIKGLSRIVIDRIVKRSDGNPYFIEEVVRSFIDEGVVVVKDGFFKASEKIDRVVIPNTINDLLMARIDRLEEQNRRLVKTASVIGRNFFYRILREVEKSIIDIDSRLSYLIEIELIMERKRLEEIEYLFKHSLAQEAAYESILIENRRVLHRKVAESIEKVFSENLQDFYGILSYHYINADNIDKAEEFMVKAGEEALKSSASSESVTFFKEALRLYQNRLGTNADPDKVAYMQKCIAVGYYNRGQLVESVPYLKNVLEYHGIKESKNIVYGSIKALLCFIMFFMRLHMPFLRKNKIATKKEKEMFDLWFKKTSASGAYDKGLFLREGIRPFNSLSNYDLRTVENGVGFYLGASLIFSYSGISFFLGKKILDRAKRELEGNDPKGAVYYQMSKLLLAFFSGNLEKDLTFDENLVIQNLKIGEVLFTTFYYIHLIFQHIEKGNFNDTIDLIQGLSGIIETYRCDYSKSNLFYVTARLLLKMRKLPQALNAADQSIAYAIKAGELLVLSQTYSIKARMHVLMKDIDKAEISLKKAESVGIDKMYPLYSSEVFLSSFVINLSKLDTISVGKDKESVSKYQKEVLKSGKKAAGIIKKAVYNSVELYRYMGIYYWRANKQKTAFKYWGKSIEKGEYMGTRPELARTYFEVGKRLLDKTSKQKKLDGIGAEEYLNKARNIFENLDLEWDLRQFENSNL